MTSYCCPLCKGALTPSEEAYHCPSCERTYPITLGFPDFRVSYAPGMEYEEDLEQATYLHEKAETLSFDELHRLYWEEKPAISSTQVDRFTQRARALVQKGEQNLQEIADRSSAPLSTNSALEIGCGTGGFLVAAHRHFDAVVGTDIGLQWLVIARKRLDEANVDVPLVCAGAEHLPFPADQFDLVVAEDVIEHVQNQKQTVQESARVLNRHGLLFLATPNRLSLTPEPHVGVWGVGFLPRRWMDAYVQWIKDVPYDDIRNLSYFELKHLLQSAQLSAPQFIFPKIPEEERENFSYLKQQLVSIYDIARSSSFLRPFFYLFGPFFHVISRADKDGDAPSS